MEVEKVFRNTRIYDLNGDYEAIHCRMGWKTNNPSSAVPKSKRGESKDYQQNRNKTLQKAKSKIRRLIRTYKLFRFVTLTFAENMDETRAADHEFRKFMKRLQRRYSEFKYIAVREFQDRGAIHYHLAVNSFIPQRLLSELWGQGFVWIEKKKGKDDRLANYLVKYITKHANDERLQGVHSYLCSHGLKLSTVDRYFNSLDEVRDYLSSLGKKKDNQFICFFDDIVWIK
ncbi:MULTISPECIES: hypothetical protein [unclassified Paenibacillus]|uniref:rolling circle replication-associated protein n=1 Tax=unclassified Paenibacillus TaxID=185978 RepID=UPI001AE5C41F|nr:MULTISPECIES: hypothetical protein [unclassified Paenibacillus]MBP1154850.1 hypothetical protein [Paenibacillus sp. PvP091]MBP1169766.1 hypothetical protein [Paenibacillus sp. PvR098]MBP2440794.1 hypothetical protein [Paenibacillus sp. PvP052]